MRKIAIALLAAAIFGPTYAAIGTPLDPPIIADASLALDAIPSAISTSIAADLGLCAEATNRYRESVGLPPLRRSSALEDFATRAASVDGVAHAAHNFFVATNGAGVSSAETEILWWQGFSVRSVVERGLAQMWQVGPGGDHYDIMVGAYSEIGCGIAVNGLEVTVTQDFR